MICHTYDEPRRGICKKFEQIVLRISVLDQLICDFVWKYCVCEFVCVTDVRLLYTNDCLERTELSKWVFNRPDRTRAASCTSLL